MDGRTYDQKQYVPQKVIWSWVNKYLLRELDTPGNVSAIFGLIVYNRATVYKRKNFLKVVVHVNSIGQYNQTAR